MKRIVTTIDVGNIPPNKNDIELDKWKDVAKKLNLALIHCFSWIGCDECRGIKYCEKCLTQLDIMEDAVEEYYKLIE